MNNLYYSHPILFYVSGTIVIITIMVTSISLITGMTFEPEWKSSLVFENKHLTFLEIDVVGCQYIVDKLNTESNKSFECEKVN